LNYEQAACLFWFARELDRYVLPFSLKRLNVEAAEDCGENHSGPLRTFPVAIGGGELQWRHRLLARLKEPFRGRLAHLIIRTPQLLDPLVDLSGSLAISFLGDGR